MFTKICWKMKNKHYFQRENAVSQLLNQFLATVLCYENFEILAKDALLEKSRPKNSTTLLQVLGDIQ